LLGVVEMATLIFFVGAIIFLAWLFGSDHSKPESPYKYEAKNEPPQLPPLNYDVEPEPMSDEEYFLSRRGTGEIYDTYDRLCYVIQNSKSTAKRLAACEESYEILPAFVRANLRDFGNIPNSIPCRDYGVEMYMRQGEWAKARSAIEKCAVAGVYDDDGQEMYDYLERYQQAAQAALSFLEKNPGYLQRNLYKALPEVDRDCLKKFARSSQLIRKEPQGNTNRLYVE